MRIAMLAVAAVVAGCAAAPAHVTTATARFASAEPYLADGSDASAGRRVRSAKLSARWSPGDAEIVLSPRIDDLAQSPMPVIDERADAVRVLLADDRVRAVAWIDRSALRRVPHVTVDVALAADAQPSPDAGIALAPGVPVELGELRGTRRHVAITGSETTVQLEGWIDDASLADVYVQTGSNVETAYDGKVVAGTQVLAAPGGAAIATIPEGYATRDAQAAATPGFVPIRWSQHGVTVRGVVADAAFAAVAPVTGMTFEGVIGGSSSITDTPVATLRAGAMFYDHPDGHVVGRVAKAMTIYAWDKPERGAWSGAVLVDVPVLGLVKAYVHREDITPGFVDAGNG